MFINEIWDRIEKVLYLIIDGLLNWYFLRVVKANLIKNGLTKYNKLLKFNQRIIGVSLLMDVMIIAAMSIPNSFVYVDPFTRSILSTRSVLDCLANELTPQLHPIPSARLPRQAQHRNDHGKSDQTYRNLNFETCRLRPYGC